MPSPTLFSSVTERTIESNYYYLNAFKPAEIEKLEKLYGLSAQQLEDAIKQHRLALYFNKTENFISLAVGLCFALYIYKTGARGYKRSYLAFEPDAKEVPEEWLALNIPSSIILAFMNLITFPAGKRSIESTIAYSQAKPIKTHMQNILEMARHSPGELFIELGKLSVTDLLPRLANAISGITYAVASDPYFEKLDPVTRNILRVPFYYFVMIYLGHLYNPNYRKGLDFWQNKNNYPWIVNYIKEKPALVLQTWFQALCSIGIRVYPQFYFVLDYMNTKLNLSKEDRNIVLGVGLFIGIIHSAILLYPATFLNYWAKHIDNEKRLTDNPWVVDDRQTLELATAKEIGRNKITQDNFKLLSFIIQTGLGAVIGYQVSESLDSIPATVGISFLIAAALGTLSLSAEGTSYTDSVLNKRLKDDNEIMAQPRKTPCERATHSAVFLLNVINALAGNVTSTLGITPESRLAGIFALIGCQKAANWVMVMQPVFEETVSSYGSYISGFFKKSRSVAALDNAMPRLEPIELKPIV